MERPIFLLPRSCCWKRAKARCRLLRTTPLTSTAYITSKVITLTSFALIESGIVYFVAFFRRADEPNPNDLWRSDSWERSYSLVGLGQVASHDSVTGFLFPGAMIVTLIMELPMFHVILGSEPFWYLIPTHGSFLLMLGREPKHYGARGNGCTQFSFPSFQSSLAFFWTKSQIRAIR